MFAGGMIDFSLFKRFKIFASLAIGGLGGVSVGAVLGFSAILLPKLGPDVTVTEKSWIGNLELN